MLVCLTGIEISCAKSSTPEVKYTFAHVLDNMLSTSPESITRAKAIKPRIPAIVSAMMLNLELRPDQF